MSASGSRRTRREANDDAAAADDAADVDDHATFDNGSESVEPDSDPGPAAELGIAEAVAQLDAMTAERDHALTERDDYLDQLQRQRAEFRNFRRRVEEDRRQQVSAGVSRLVDSLLPVLDGCDAAVAQGLDDVVPVAQSLLVALAKSGLERIEAVGSPFDPNEHEAVIVETAPRASSDDDGASDADRVESDGIPADAQGDAVQMVIEELRGGYRFDGRVLRAAMVKVRAG